MELTHLALPQPAIVLEMGGLRLYPKDWEQISVHRTIADIKERLRDKAAIVRPGRHGPDVRPVPTDQRCRVQAELLDMVTIAEHMAVADAALFVLMVAASADAEQRAGRGGVVPAGAAAAAHAGGLLARVGAYLARGRAVRVSV